MPHATRSSLCLLFMCISRDRPEVVRSLKGAKVVKVCCGGYHSLALTADSKVRSHNLTLVYMI